MFYAAPCFSYSRSFFASSGRMNPIPISTSGVRMFMANWKYQVSVPLWTPRGNMPMMQAKAVKAKHQNPASMPRPLLFTKWYSET